MILGQRFSSYLACSLAGTALLLSGCAATRQSSLVNSFLPAAPPAPSLNLEETRRGPVNPYLTSLPILEIANREPQIPSAPKATGVEEISAKAEAHYEAGKRAYAHHDPTLARQEFDLALTAILTRPETGDSVAISAKLDALVDSIYRFDVDGLGSGQNRDGLAYEKAPIDSFLAMTFPTDPKLKPKVKEEILATVSQLPLEENDTVDSFIHYFSTERGHRTLTVGLKRAGRYRPLIQQILDEEGVPQELIYLAQLESGFAPRALSNRQAVGMWQFVSFRGREYGLEQTRDSDERLDPEKATRAAARHLRDLYNTFGDWYLAMAAYDCGPGCVDHAVQRTGYADFWELCRLNALPKETMNYVPAILAMTIMSKNAKDYDLDNLVGDRPVEYDSVALDSAANLELIADATGHPMMELHELNPALLHNSAPAGYQLHVPKGTSTALLSAFEALAPEHRKNWRVHRVELGETIAEISKRFGTSPQTIAQANHYAVAGPEAGDLLVIPAAFTPERTIAKKRGTAGISRRSRRSQGAVSARVLDRRAPARYPRTASLRSSAR